MSTSQFLSQALLDWALGGATPTRPSARFVGLANGTPSSIAASELTIAGYTRQTITFGAASTPTSSGSVTCKALFTFSFGAAATAVGIQLWDASAAGNMLYYGLLSASSIMSSGDILSFASAGFAVRIL